MGCKWSSLNALGTGNPSSHPLLGLDDFPFSHYWPSGWGNKYWPASIKWTWLTGCQTQSARGNYGQNCHHSSQLSQKFTMIDNFHKDSYLLIIVTIVNNCHNYWLFSKLLRMSQLPFIKICHSCQNWSKSLLLITINCNCIGQTCHNWSKLSQLVTIV